MSGPLGGKITALTVQARNKRRVNVYLDGAFAFALPDVVAACLRVGQSLTDEQSAALQQQGVAEWAYDRALRFLSYRPRSVDELTRHLLAKKVPENLVAATVARLVQAGLLDDAQFARFWVDNRENFRPRGTAALRYELRRKGLTDDTIDSALREVNEREGAYRVALPQARRLAGADRATFRRRLGAYLSRRGYSYETVRDTTDRLWRENSAESGADQGQTSERSRR